MSAIAGDIGFTRGADEQAVRTMTDAMATRGPDGAGVLATPTVALGHRRLAVIDPSAAGAQPMQDRHLGLTVVLDGSLYNYRQVRAELTALGYTFTSDSDAEVLLRGYHAWGEGVVERLDGAFAFAVAERDGGRVLLGRDRLGVAPLYLAEVAGGLRFASTLPALLRAGGVDTGVDPVALHHYLSFHAVVPAPRTILSGVRRLPPATVLRIEADGTRVQREYWTPDFTRSPARAGWSPQDWEGAVLEAVRTAVRRSLVADVPVGCLLSGGVDSSLLVGLLAEAGQGDLQTFSIGFEAVAGQAGDEFVYSDLIADHYGTRHHRIRVDTARMLPALSSAIGAMSEPMVSHDCVAFHLLSQEVSRHVTVVQSGQGADEVFAGYHWYPPLGQVADADIGGALASYRAAFFDRSHQALTDLLQPQWRVREDVSSAFVGDHFAAPGADTATDRALRLDTTVMAVDDPVKRVDNMTMAWGLQARMPFLDHELVDLAGSCPPELKTAHGGKGVLKEAARRVIPAAVIDRPKGYFPVPALTYLQGPYLDLVRDAVRSDAARDRGLFAPAAVEALLADPNGRLTPLHGNPLWQVSLLELWLATHVDGAAL